MGMDYSGDFEAAGGAFSFAPVASAFAVLGLLLTALYLLTFYGRVFLGPLNKIPAAAADLSGDEKLVVIPAIYSLWKEWELRRAAPASAAAAPSEAPEEDLVAV